jgi:hypothetical protein
VRDRRCRRNVTEQLARALRALLADPPVPIDGEKAVASMLEDTTHLLISRLQTTEEVRPRTIESKGERPDHG